MTAPLKNINTLIGMKAGEAFERLFGTKPPKATIEINDTVKEYNNARSWWERASGAAIQCNNTIGKIGDINNAGIPCYICGIPMTTEFDSESAECEHILPIYQASLLLKLYHNESEDGNKATKKIISEYDNKIYNLEYKWSHACCNQIKSDLSFLSTTKKNGSEEYSMSDKNAKKILDKIWEGGHSKCSPKLMKEIKKQPKKDFTIKRIKAIKEETMNPIIEELNKELNKKDSSKGLYYLSILANSISSINRRNFEMAVQGDAYREPPNYTEMRLKAYAEISAVLSNIFINTFSKFDALTTHSLELLNIITESDMKFNIKMKETSIASILYESFIKDDISDELSNLINKQSLFMDTFSFSYNKLKDTNMNDYDVTLKSILNASNALKYYILTYIITQKSKMEETASKLRGRGSDKFINSINSFYKEIDTSSKILLLDMYPQVNDEMKKSITDNIIPNNLNIVSKYVYDYVNYHLFDKTKSNLETFAKTYYDADGISEFRDTLIKIRSNYLQTSGDKYSQKSVDTKNIEGHIVEDIELLKKKGINESNDGDFKPDVKSKRKISSQDNKEDGLKLLITVSDIIEAEKQNEIKVQEKETLEAANIMTNLGVKRGRETSPAMDIEAANIITNLGVKRGRESSNNNSNNKSSAMDIETAKTITPRPVSKSYTRKRRRMLTSPIATRVRGGKKTHKKSNKKKNI